MLVSPTEPAELKMLGKVSSQPEKHGADFLMYSPVVGRVGVQRKEIGDLVASLGDRLAREIPLLQQLDIGLVLIEGRIEWTNDGTLLSAGGLELSRAQYLGIVWSIQSSGLWIGSTSSLTETTTFLSLFSRWVTKERHHSLLRRNKRPARNAYGEARDRDWQIFFLQGLPGLGYERAASVVDFYGGLPLQWTGVLTEIPGIGDGLWRKLAKLLEREGDAS